jgi:hypothetical protein
MEENVRKLEGQLKDQFKGQLDMVAIAKENIELSNKVRELEKKLQLYSDRIKEYDEILRVQTDETEKALQQEKVMRGENEGLKKTTVFLEE